MVKGACAEVKITLPEVCFCRFAAEYASNCHFRCGALSIFANLIINLLRSFCVLHHDFYFLREGEQ